MKKMSTAHAALALLCFGLCAIDPDPGLRTAVKVEGFKDLFRTGDVFIAGQPTLEMLRWLKAQGVTLVVNIRTEAENKEFTALAFNEENLARELGMAYAALPVAEKESLAPKTVDAFAGLLAGAGGRTLLHCAAAGRATHLWMAYLVRHRGFDVDEAAVVGRKMKFTLPFEDFLGGRIVMKLEEPKK